MSCEECQNSNKKTSFSFDLSCAYERCPAEVKARNFSLSCRSGNDICQQHKSICDNVWSYLSWKTPQKMHRRDFKPYLLTQSCVVVQRVMSNTCLEFVYLLGWPTWHESKQQPNEKHVLWKWSVFPKFFQVWAYRNYNQKRISQVFTSWTRLNNFQPGRDEMKIVCSRTVMP